MSNAAGGFRSATPNKRGEYSAATMDELESQNDDQVSEMTKKVRMLKDVMPLLILVTMVSRY